MTGTARRASTSTMGPVRTNAVSWRPSSRGRRGGPMAIVGGLVTKWLPTQTTQIDMQEQGGTLTATVVGVGEVHSQRLTNDAGQPTLMQKPGLRPRCSLTTRQRNWPPAVARMGGPGHATPLRDPVRCRGHVHLERELDAMACNPGAEAGARQGELGAEPSAGAAQRQGPTAGRDTACLCQSPS